MNNCERNQFRWWRVIRSMKKVIILENSYLNTYVLKVIHEDDEVLVGEPIRNNNKRLRVDKTAGEAEILPDARYAEREGDKYSLEHLDDNVPEWAEEYADK